MLAEWLALIVELDVVSRQALGVDAKGFGRKNAIGMGRKKRSWSFTKGSVFTAGKTTAYSTASGGSRPAAEGGGGGGAAAQGMDTRRRSNSFLSYFVGGGTSDDNNADPVTMTKAELKAAAEEANRAGREQQMLAEAIRVHKNKMRELAQREARARADSAEASWQVAVAEAEARAAEEELARAPPLLDAEKENSRSSTTSLQYGRRALYGPLSRKHFANPKTLLGCHGPPAHTES